MKIIRKLFISISVLTVVYTAYLVINARSIVTGCSAAELGGIFCPGIYAAPFMVLIAVGAILSLILLIITILHLQRSNNNSLDPQSPAHPLRNTWISGVIFISVMLLSVSGSGKYQGHVAERISQEYSDSLSQYPHEVLLPRTSDSSGFSKIAHGSKLILPPAVFYVAQRKVFSKISNLAYNNEYFSYLTEYEGTVSESGVLVADKGYGSTTVGYSLALCSDAARTKCDAPVNISLPYSIIPAGGK